MTRPLRQALRGFACVLPFYVLAYHLGGWSAFWCFAAGELYVAIYAAYFVIAPYKAANRALRQALHLERTKAVDGFDQDGPGS